MLKEKFEGFSRKLFKVSLNRRRRFFFDLRETFSKVSLWRV
jgi:hypothetical protein